MGLSAGTTILISQFFGARDNSSLSKAVHTGICFALAGGLALSVLGFLVAPLCLKAMEVPRELFGGSLSYVRILFGGFALSMLYNVGAGILRAVGDSRTPFYVLIVAGGANVVLDLVFVAIFKMNAPGAALATVLAQGLSAVLVLRVLLRTRAPYRVSGAEFRVDKAMLHSICRIGLPVGLQSALYPVANMVVQSGINRTGTDNIAAWALCGKLDFMIWLIADSLSEAVATFVAQNHGAGKYARTRYGVRVGLFMTVGFIALISAALFFGSVSLGRLLINPADLDLSLIHI